LTFASGTFLFCAAALGGAINSVAGGGSFIAFPALLLTGAAPIPANATNAIALWPGSAASAFAYREELHEVRRDIVPLGAAALVGGFAGSLLLLRTPERAFVLLIPWLLLFATMLFSLGGALSARRAQAEKRRIPRPLAAIVLLVISVYGGYFGGGMGIMMLAVLSLAGMTNIHRMNALKTVLAAVANGIAVVAFLFAGAVDWAAGGVMIAGGIAGGYAGAAIARRSDARRVRAFVLAIAWTMTVYFFVRTYR
jgi:uncharacterized membrane protein YfcA